MMNDFIFFSDDTDDYQPLMAYTNKLSSNITF